VYNGDLFLPLLEYPVGKVFAVFVYVNSEILEPDFYKLIPDCSTEIDLPFSLSLSPAVNKYCRLKAVRAAYWHDGQYPRGRQRRRAF